MGDFWGVPKEMDDHKGTSLIFLNTPKADNIFQKIKNNFIKIKEYPASLAVKIQPHLSHSVAKHPARKDFFAKIDGYSLKENLAKNLCSRKNVALLNFSCGNENFGALLTSVALNKCVNGLGYNAQNIDYIRNQPWIKEQPDNKFFDDFREKHLPRTKKFYYGDDLSVLNEVFYTFIVGSDQVWQPELTRDEEDIFLLDFVHSDKNVMSYAASFGTERLTVSDDLLDFYKYRLSCFNHVSVREASGVNICANLGVKAENVLDPVFLLQRKEWDALARDIVTNEDCNQVVYYTIDENIRSDIVKFIQQNEEIFLSAEPVDITQNISVEEWLSRIKNCKFFITDSFHGCCFAIIFNKSFVCVNPNIRTSARMLGLFNELGIKGRLFNSFSDENIKEALVTPIQWSNVDKRIESLRDKSLEYLKNALSYVVTYNDIKENGAKIQAYRQRIYMDVIKNRKIYKIKKIFYHVAYKFLVGKSRKKIKQKYQSYKERCRKVKQIIKRCKREQ